MSCARIIDILIKYPSYIPLDYFFHFPKNYCTPHTSTTFYEIFMKLYRNVYQVKTICRVQLWLLSVSELCSFDCVLGLFCVIYILVHSRTHSLFMIS